MSQLVALKYVGRKPAAYDNIAHSGKVWNGPGDVQEVTDAQAKLLLKYPDQWALVNPADQARVDAPVSITAVDEHGDTVTVDPEALNRPIERMSKPELVAYAKQKFGKKLDARKSTKQMIDMIEEWMVDPTA